MSSASGTRISSSVRAGIDVACLERDGQRELFATALSQPGESFQSIFRRTKRMLEELEAQIVRMHVFGSLDAYQSCRSAALEQLGDVDWPMSYVQGASCSGGAIAGMQVHAVSGVPVETVCLNGRPVGRVFEDGFARFCYLGDLSSDDGSSSRSMQERVAFERIEQGLESAGMGLSDLVRTWFFIDDILDWYGEFNSVRDAFFTEKGMFDRFLPASTGIGGANPRGAAVLACAVALQASPRGAGVTVQEVLSPLQCPAHDYGSSFSRAAEIATPAYRSVLVSGTASIHPDGTTAHVGDAASQIDLTLRVVEEILKTRDMNLADTTRASAYFRHQHDASGFGEFCERFDLPAARVVVSHDAVCRDDLLFEIEVDAVNVSR